MSERRSLSPDAARPIQGWPRKSSVSWGLRNPKWALLCTEKASPAAAPLGARGNLNSPSSRARIK